MRLRWFLAGAVLGQAARWAWQTYQDALALLTAADEGRRALRRVLTPPPLDDAPPPGWRPLWDFEADHRPRLGVRR